ncbi:MAG TPA: ATP-binding protein, partial [Bryobacterales bacterium]|nr:ATP-binding protein [Bryobacterales bacterium]
PIRATLSADRAAMKNDRQGEIIADEKIPGDEIGDIMRSRNATVANLREQEASLARTLVRLEELTTDLRKKNRQLEEAKEKMAAQDRLASIGLLSAGVAHELNTPLSVLTGSIEKLLETVDDPGARGRLERMQRVAGRLKQISAGLLDFSRPAEETMAPVALKPLIEEVWELVAIDERASRVMFENQAGGECVTGNRDRLVQLFVNLLRNALYAIDGAGSIVVRVREESRAGKREVVVAVEDDGVGIPEDVLPNIFDAFVTRRLDSRGTGLGLTVAEGIVQQHGGVLRASNRAEGGARFEVRLPAAGPAAASLPDATVSGSRKAV